MTWPDAFTIVGVALAIALITFASVWNGGRKND